MKQGTKWKRNCPVVQTSKKGVKKIGKLIKKIREKKLNENVQHCEFKLHFSRLFLFLSLS